MKQDTVPIFPIEVGEPGDSRHPIFQSQLPVIIRFINSSNVPVTVTFMVSPAPFSELPYSFTVPPHGFVDMTIPAGTSVGTRHFTCTSGRTGDIDILPG